MRKDERGTYQLTWVWLTLWLFQFPLHSNAMVVWKANMELEYFSKETNKTLTYLCECGLYGSNSPLQEASGYVALPTWDIYACSPNTTFNITRKPWIALIQRGNCTHADKIRAAEEKGASAVVIYNIDGTGTSLDPMSHPGADNIVAIMISNIMGRKIISLVENASEVHMNLFVGTAIRFWGNPLWVYVMSFTFFGITAIILGYFIFVVIKRLYRNRQLRIQQRELKKVAERAIAKLQVRTLRRNDPEIEVEETSCAVCIDSFKRGDIVTTLPCSHLFHKTCITPWLLEHHTCPMCKYDILKGEVGIEPSLESSRPPADVRFHPSSVSGSLPETPALEQHAATRPGSDTPAAQRAVRGSNHVYEVPNTRRREHIYENPTFEGEPQIPDHENSNQIPQV